MTIAKIRLVGDFAVRLDDMTWPRQYGRTGDLNWLLRYGTPDEIMKQRLVIASVLSAYSQMVGDTREQRQAVVAALRKAEDMAHAALQASKERGSDG